jgi:hypothetical protein
MSAAALQVLIVNNSARMQVDLKIFSLTELMEGATQVQIQPQLEVSQIFQIKKVETTQLTLITLVLRIFNLLKTFQISTM